MSQPTEKTLRSYLNNAEMQLNRGEKVRVTLNERLHSLYVNYQMEGDFPDLLCIRERGDYYLARIR